MKNWRSSVTKHLIKAIDAIPIQPGEIAEKTVVLQAINKVISLINEQELKKIEQYD